METYTIIVDFLRNLRTEDTILVTLAGITLFLAALSTIVDNVRLKREERCAKKLLFFDQIEDLPEDHKMQFARLLTYLTGSANLESRAAVRRIFLTRALSLEEKNSLAQKFIRERNASLPPKWAFWRDPKPIWQEFAIANKLPV